MRPFLVVGLVLLTAGCGAAVPPAGQAAHGERPGALGADDERPGRREGRAPAAPGEAVAVPRSASGRYEVVGGSEAARSGPGEAVRYLVEVERGLPFDGRAFAAQVHRTLNDRRGWTRFRRVARGPVRLRVALSSPRLTDRRCRPLRTGGHLSCWNGTRSVINALRWARGVPQYGGDLAAYRHYLISHEVGHALGHRHRACPGPGRLAPVMVQQSKSLGRCRPNPWPHPGR
ncbi:DUF3152 domain-containing protein [Nonomuraea sp. SBT364]|uniref:DUF3152 domain-containing protein n=1 Tax=Nonomuraea sp. SBT364 TaxID=1580530 RepID=UPI00066B0EF3|nr:DUF3152 domain-containing protein [Nonomuraea sp. SBT364]